METTKVFGFDGRISWIAQIGGVLMRRQRRWTIALYLEPVPVTIKPDGKVFEVELPV